MGLMGAGAACAVAGFPKTQLVDDSPLVGAGEFSSQLYNACRPQIALGLASVTVSQIDSCWLTAVCAQVFSLAPACTP